MKDKPENSKHERFIEEIEAKQRNTIWPDAMKNSSCVDAFLWKGFPDAPLVQRMGAWIFGMFFLFSSLCFIEISYEKRSWVVFFSSIPILLLGVKVFLNGFRRHRDARHKSK